MSAVTLEPDDRLELEASARIRHRAAGRVDAAVLAWCRWYTGDLPDEVAAERRAELASDLFEEREQTGDRATGSILGRAVRGIPADLAWRGARLRHAALGAPRGTFPLAMPALAHLAAIALVAWGAFIVWRIVRSVLIGDWHGAADVAELSSPASSWRSSGRGCSWSRADARSPASCSRSRPTCSFASAPTPSWRRA